jgi:lipopolysaccharide/colanic/teichoic acid biosynthesis glycosyltransferase
MQYLDRYTPEQARRHEVKPGITPVKWLSPQLNRKDKNIQRGKDFTGQAGWAQVNGRNADVETRRD